MHLLRCIAKVQSNRWLRSRSYGVTGCIFETKWCEGKGALCIVQNSTASPSPFTQRVLDVGCWVLRCGEVVWVVVWRGIVQVYFLRCIVHCAHTYTFHPKGVLRYLQCIFEVKRCGAATYTIHQRNSICFALRALSKTSRRMTLSLTK